MQQGQDLRTDLKLLSYNISYISIQQGQDLRTDLKLLSYNICLYATGPGFKDRS